jgi:hypothetical protein
LGAVDDEAPVTVFAVVAGVVAFVFAFTGSTFVLLVTGVVFVAAGLGAVVVGFVGGFVFFVSVFYRGLIVAVVFG